MSYANLSKRTFFRLSGPDSLRYLNGQITQEIANIQPNETRYTFICDLKGRIQSDAFIRLLESGDLLLDAPAEVRENLFARLNHYLIADDCELFDESGQWQLYHEFTKDDDAQISRFGITGRDHLSSASPPVSFSPVLNREDIEHLRLTHCIPALPDILYAFPAETGQLDRAVSFTKGCYQGQEIISRMKRAGKTNRSLVRLKIPELPKELPGAFTQGDSEKTALLITSASQRKDSNNYYPALGYLYAAAKPRNEFLFQGKPFGIQVLSV